RQSFFADHFPRDTPCPRFRFWYSCQISVRLHLLSSFHFSAILSFAERARGLSSTSASDGIMGLRLTILSVWRCPHTHTGKSGGHVHPSLPLRNRSFTRRSSKE